MKIAAINNQKTLTNQQQNRNKTNPSFRGVGIWALDLAGYSMQKIENLGYALSFLIQDGLGMTAPRVATGLYRDTEVTGNLNFAEAKEVFLRETLTGPYMMAVAPAMIVLSGLFCKSASTNTRLIKIMGKHLKEMLKSPSFDKSVQSDAEKFQKEFHKFSIEKFYKQTVPNDENADETIKFILEQFEGGYHSSSRSKRMETLSVITNKINEKLIETSSNLDELCRLSTETNGGVQTFTIERVLDAIKKYSSDAIKKNKHAAEINEEIVDNITNNLATGRLLFNVANIAATLGGLSVIPKIYARNSVAPGAAHLINNQTEDSQTNKTPENNISFKGKGINSKNIITKIGKFLTEKIPKWIQNEFEYDGFNFTKTLMASLALLGLLLPRGLKAYNRALVDENGKKDMTEVNEILLRDTFSSLSVVYTVPILTKLFVSLSEKHNGFILTNRASQGKTWWQETKDILNPYSDLRVLSNQELQALYNNVDSKEKMINLCEYVDKKGGNIEKILRESQNAKEIFNDNAVKFETKLKRAEKNERIISYFKNLNKTECDELVKKLMKDAGNIKQGTITRIARGLNSVPGFLTTVIISPIILGVLIPKLTYSNTRKAHEKMTFGNNAVQG